MAVLLVDKCLGLDTLHHQAADNMESFFKPLMGDGGKLRLNKRTIENVLAEVCCCPVVGSVGWHELHFTVRLIVSWHLAFVGTNNRSLCRAMPGFANCQDGNLGSVVGQSYTS